MLFKKKSEDLVWFIRKGLLTCHYSGRNVAFKIVKIEGVVLTDKMLRINLSSHSLEIVGGLENTRKDLYLAIIANIGTKE